MKDAWISCYLYTKYLNVLWIEQILHNFEDQKFDNYFNPEQVDFHVTLTIYVYYEWRLYVSNTIMKLKD